MKKPSSMLWGIWTLAIGATALQSCAYLQKTEAVVADAVGSYCGESSALHREIVRERLAPELIAEGLEVCLGCAGDAETYCTGSHRPKTDTGS